MSLIRLVRSNMTQSLQIFFFLPKQERWGGSSWITSVGLVFSLVQTVTLFWPIELNSSPHASLEPLVGPFSSTRYCTWLLLARNHNPVSSFSNFLSIYLLKTYAGMSWQTRAPSSLLCLSVSCNKRSKLWNTDRGQLVYEYIHFHILS